jgi:uncharacterized membrane protein YphA (DoxX/SURF4 family)
MDVALWIGQGLLAALFLGSGLAKLSMSRERLIETGQTSAKIVPMPLMRFTASCELAGAAGLVLPWLTGIVRVLTPVAGIGLGIVMIGAAIVHSRLREPRNILINMVILAVCVFVSWGRFAQL